jgi:predicted small integral membrane protein
VIHLTTFLGEVTLRFLGLAWLGLAWLGCVSATIFNINRFNIYQIKKARVLRAFLDLLNSKTRLPA